MTDLILLEEMMMMMMMIDAEDAVRRIMTLEKLARSDAQKALLGRCIYIIERCPVADAEPV